MRILLSILFMLVCSTAHAGWYVMNSENRAIARTSYLPDKADLESRGEYAVYSDVDIALTDAEYRGGEIKVRAKSQEEKNKEASDKAINDKKIEDFNSAKAKLIALGFSEDEVESLR